MDADQLYAVVPDPGDEGVHGAVQLKGGHPGGAAKLVKAAHVVVGVRGGLQRAVAAVYAHQLDGAVPVHGNDRVRGVAHEKGIRAVGVPKRAKVVLAAAGLVRGL